MSATPRHRPITVIVGFAIIVTVVPTFYFAVHVATVKPMPATSSWFPKDSVATPPVPESNGFYQFRTYPRRHRGIDREARDMLQRAATVAWGELDNAQLEQAFERNELGADINVLEHGMALPSFADDCGCSTIPVFEVLQRALLAALVQAKRTSPAAGLSLLAHVLRASMDLGHSAQSIATLVAASSIGTTALKLAEAYFRAGGRHAPLVDQVHQTHFRRADAARILRQDLWSMHQRMLEITQGPAHTQLRFDAGGTWTQYEAAQGAWISYFETEPEPAIAPQTHFNEGWFERKWNPLGVTLLQSTLSTCNDTGALLSTRLAEGRSAHEAAEKALYEPR